MNRWYTVALSQDKTTGEIVIYDEIGGWGKTAMDFLQEVRALGDVKKLAIRIDSGGGDVGTAIAMFNILKRHPAKVEVTVDAISASAATLVQMAGDDILMPENSAMFLHNPMAIMFGYYNSADLRTEAEATDKFRELMLKTYGARVEPEKVATILDASTWLTAAEAVEQGFATKLLPVSAAKATAAIANLAKPPPAAIVARMQANAPDPAPSPPAPPAPGPTPPAPPPNPAADGDAVAKAVAAERERVSEIHAACALKGREDLAAGFVKDGMTLGAVLAKLAEVPRRSGRNDLGGQADPNELNSRRPPGGDDPEADVMARIVKKQNARFDAALGAGKPAQ